MDRGLLAQRSHHLIGHQPHFIGQPADVEVLWGYGLSVDRPGDFVGKPMFACTGAELLTEVLGHEPEVSLFFAPGGQGLGAAWRTTW